MKPPSSTLDPDGGGALSIRSDSPVYDGNGRTGRVLNTLFLIQENLLTLPILYLSRYIIGHKPITTVAADVTRRQSWKCGCCSFSLR